MKALHPKAISMDLFKRLTEAKRDFGRMRTREPNILTFIVYGLLFDVVVNLWKPFSVKFLERIGGGELEISLLNSLPGIAAATVLLPGALFLSRFSNKKKATASFILASRALLLAVALIPVLPSYVRPMLFVFFIAAMNVPDALSQTSLQSFLGSVFSGHTRAQAIALRHKFGNVAIPLITVITGIMITFIPSSDHGRMILYQVFFVFAFITGLAEVFVFKRFKVGQNDGGADGKVTAIKPEAVKYVLKDKKFKTFLWPTLFFAFSWYAGWPICSIYQVQNLGANELWFAIFALTSGIGAFAAAGFWHKFIRKYGNGTAFQMATLLIAVNLILFPLSPNVVVMSIFQLFGGAVSIGVSTAMLNGVLEATPDENRLVYMAAFNTALNLGLFLAPLLSHLLLSLSGIYGAFIIVTLMRLAASFVLLFKKEQHGLPKI